MRSAIVTDIHANIQAWNAVLKDIDKMGCSQILCLGDVIGYGPNPAEVMESTYSRLNGCILGNHDAVIAGRLDKELFNDNAKAIIEWTQKQLSDDAAAYFADMPLVMESDEFLCAHAEPASPGRFNYIYEPADAVASFEAVTQPLMFVGHTHLPCYFELDPENNLRKKAGQDFIVTPGSRFLVNAGSVGDPRDGRVAASYVIYDHDQRKVIFRQVPFDIQGFRRNLLASGLSTTPFFLRVADGQMQETQTLKDMIVSDKAVKDNSPGISRIGSQSRPEAGRKLNFASSSTSARYQAAKEQQEAIAAASNKKGIYIGAGVLGVAALALGGLMIANKGQPAPPPSATAVGNPPSPVASTNTTPLVVAGLADGGKLLRFHIESFQQKTKSSGIPYLFDMKGGSRDLLIRELTKDAHSFSEPSGSGTTLKLPDGLTFDADARLLFWHDGNNYSTSPEIVIQQSGGKSAPLKLDDPVKKTHQGVFLDFKDLTEGVPLGLAAISSLSHKQSGKKFPAYIAQYFEDETNGDLQIKIQIPKEGLDHPVLKLVLQSKLKSMIDEKTGIALPLLNEQSLYDDQAIVYTLDLSQLSPGSSVLTLKGKNKPRLVSATLGSRLPQAKSDWRFGESQIPVIGKVQRSGSCISSTSGLEFSLPSYDLPKSGFTFDLVVKIDETESDSALFSFCKELNKQITEGFRINANSRGLSLEAPGQKSELLPLNKGQWQRVILTWNPATLSASLCANGQSQVLKLNSAPEFPTGPFVIGAFRDDNQSSSPALIGALHRARILPEAISYTSAVALSKNCPAEALLYSGLSASDIPGVYPPDDVACLLSIGASRGAEVKTASGWPLIQASGVNSWKETIEGDRAALAAKAAAAAAALAEKERLAKEQALRDKLAKFGPALEALIEGHSDTALTTVKSLPDTIPFKKEVLKLIADEKLAIHALMRSIPAGRVSTLSLTGDTKLDFKPGRYEPKTMTWTGKKMNGTKEGNSVDVAYSKLAPIEIETRLKKIKASPECKALLLLRAGLAAAAKAEAGADELAGGLLGFGPDTDTEKLLAKADYKLNAVDAKSQNIGKTHAETGDFVVWIVAEKIPKVRRVLAVSDPQGIARFFLEQVAGRLIIVEGGGYHPIENKIAEKSLIKIRYKGNQMSFADLCGEGQSTGASGLPEAVKGNDLILGGGFTVHQLVGFNIVPDETTEKKIENYLKKKWKLP